METDTAPFFGVQLFIISVYAITHYHSETFQEMAVKVLSKGGYGAGSYYPWIYIQFAILLSLLAKWLSKLSNVKIGGVILTFCIVAELVCNLLHVSEEFWRLACFRYLFLIYLGILWCKNGLRMNSTRLCLALLSAVSMAIFSYSGIDWYPFFIENAWKSYRWITYFWVAFALPILLWWVYNVFSTRLKHFVELLGKYSYEIFLCQMVVFCLPRKVFLSHLGETAGSLTFIALTISLSIVPVLIYKRIHLK